MSIMVVAIAGAHAIPVFIAAAVMGKGGVVVVAVVMSFVAVAFGGAQYSIVDLAVIWMAAFFCLKA